MQLYTIQTTKQYFFNNELISHKFDASSDFEFNNLCSAWIESSVKLKWAPDLGLTQLD